MLLKRYNEVSSLTSSKKKVELVPLDLTHTLKVVAEDQGRQHQDQQEIGRTGRIAINAIYQTLPQVRIRVSAIKITECRLRLREMRTNHSLRPDLEHKHPMRT